MSKKTIRPIKQAPIALIVLDGWGYREDSKDNAVAAAKKPFFDKLWRECPHSLLEASGLAVGLPEGQMGNSEVGHTTIGAGAILDTDLVRIDKAVKNGGFDENTVMQNIFDHVKKYAGKTGDNATLHVMGLVSDGGVHGHQEHVYEFVKAAVRAGVKKISIHVFTDGRDTPPQSAGAYLQKLEKEIKKLDPSGKHIFIASLSGRYFAMDRDSNWDRLAKAEKVIFEGEGLSTNLKPSEYLAQEYKSGVNDEWLEPIVIESAAGKGSPVGRHDAIFFTNFRADRARMMCDRMIERMKANKVSGGDLLFATMTEYSSEYVFPVAFVASKIETTLAAEISKAGLTQSHIAETEKFPHATYYLNGGRNEPHVGEVHIGLASRKDVKKHDEAPEMRAEAIADKAIEEMHAGKNFIFINFANPDVVGHTANVPAIIAAIETVDRELQRVIEALEKAGGSAIVIADHGNAEVNVDPATGLPHTAHTTNLVPCILAGAGHVAQKSQKIKLANGGLADVAPTILDLLGLKKPKAMTGASLLI